MSTKEQDFRARFIAVLRDFQQNGQNDRELLGLLGKFSVGLVDVYKLKSWTEFKRGLSARAYDQLLGDLEEHAEVYRRNDGMKAAIAIQLLAYSVIARTMTDPDVKHGEKLLDQMLDGMISAYHRGMAVRTARTH